MALVRIPYFGLIFRPFVKQEISRECLLGLLGQINPEKNFDGELMVFGAMSTRDIQARYDFLIKGGYKGPSSGEEADMAFSFDGYLQNPPDWLQTIDVRFLTIKLQPFQLTNLKIRKSMILLIFLAIIEAQKDMNVIGSPI